jgi:hypothetical protein
MLHVPRRVGTVFDIYLAHVHEDEATGKASVYQTWLVSHSLVRYVYMGKPRSSLRQIQCRFRIRTCLKFNV